jgi:hypothetical protein
MSGIDIHSAEGAASSPFGSSRSPHTRRAAIVAATL